MDKLLLLLPMGHPNINELSPAGSFTGTWQPNDNTFSLECIPYFSARNPCEKIIFILGPRKYIASFSLLILNIVYLGNDKKKKTEIKISIITMKGRIDFVLALKNCISDNCILSLGRFVT